MTTTPDPETHPARENGSLATTHWTVVLEAARQDSATGQTALAALCRTYWYPVYVFIRRGGRSPEDAEDLAQAFFERLVEKNWLTSVTREGGKFRSVLLKAVKHFLLNAHDHAQTLKRGGGRALISLDAEDPETRYRYEPVESVTPDVLFEQRLALQILEKAMERRRREYVNAEKAELFDELKVFLSGGTRSVAHDEIAARRGTA